MSQQKEDALKMESIDTEQKDDNQDQDVVETVGKYCVYIWISDQLYVLERYNWFGDPRLPCGFEPSRI